MKARMFFLVAVSVFGGMAEIGRRCSSSTAPDVPVSLAHGSVWSDQAFADALQIYNSMVDFSTDESGSSPADKNRIARPHLDALILRRTVRHIQAALRLYGPDGLVAAFNGGKDATVALTLYVACLANFYESNPSENLAHGAADIYPMDSSDLVRLQPNAVFFQGRDSEFESVISFVEAQQISLDLNLGTYFGTFVDKMQGCLADLKVSSMLNRFDSDRQVVHWAFILGVRHGDPKSETLAVFEPSSEWLSKPSPFMRVHPILNWSYGMIWDFLLEFRVPYCRLYDEGYSSLGGMKDTKVNSRLVSKEGELFGAHSLTDWTFERDGRS